MKNCTTKILLFLSFISLSTSCRTRSAESDSSSVGKLDGSGLMWVRYITEGKKNGLCWYEYQGETPKEIDVKRVIANSKPLGERAYTDNVQDKVINSKVESYEKEKRKVSETNSLNEMEKFFADIDHFSIGVDQVDLKLKGLLISIQGVDSLVNESEHIKNVKIEKIEDYNLMKSLVIEFHKQADLKTPCAIKK